MEEKIKPKLSTTNIELPYWVTIPKPKSDALDDAQIRFNHLMNFVGGVLSSVNFSNENAKIPYPEKIKVNLKTKENESVSSPDIKIQPDEREKLFKFVPAQLFNLSVVQLATLYEVFLSELIEDILWNNDKWLEIEEKQLTTKEIFDLGNLENIRMKLMERKVLDFAMLSYPKKVERFEKEFHVGLHQKKFPLSLFEVHDFLEVRNVIVHSDGHASQHYVERMKNYNQPTLIQRRFSTPKVDFSWLISFGKDLISLCSLVDEKISQKWKTTRNT